MIVTNVVFIPFQLQIMESVKFVYLFFGNKIQELQQNQSAIKRDIEYLKAKQEAIENKVTTENQDAPYLFMLPDRIEWFSGRETELDNLHNHLRVNENIKERKVVITSVCGLGGTGKTSLAAEYAHRWKNYYEGGVFWLSGEDEATFVNSVDELAVYLQTLLETSPGSTLVKTLELISKIQKRWLLILDGMDEFKFCSSTKMLLSGHWKRSVRGSGHILITTRRNPKEMGKVINGLNESQCFQLECFNPEDGKHFVFERTGITCDEETTAEATKLVQNLGGLPLALEQACAYITNLSCTLSSYLKQYEKYSLELLDEENASTVSQYQSPQRLAVRTTWLLNFEYIKQSKNGGIAVRFLNACAFFNPAEIQLELVNRGKPTIEDDAYRDYVESPLGSSHIFKLLTDFSLFQRNKGSSLTVHRLVHEVIREKVKSDDEEVLSVVDAISMLSFAFSKCPSPDDLLLGDIDKRQDRVSNLEINTSLFYPWRRLCLHAQELLAIINSLQVLDEKILMPETARIVYECALDFNISSKSIEAYQSFIFAQKLIDLGGAHLPKSGQEAVLPHEVPLLESFRRFILYSCTTPLDTAGCTSSDKNKRIGSKSKMEQMHAQGNTCFNNGNFQKAVNLYSSAMAEISSFDLKLLCDRALAYNNLHQYTNALADSEDYLLQRPKCWLGFSMKALALHGLNKIWEASSFAALGFYYNRNIFEEYQPFRGKFSALEERTFICNSSSNLTEFLVKPVSHSGGASEIPGKIIVIEPGDYRVNVDHPVTSPFFIFKYPFFSLLFEDCIFIGVDNSKSSVVLRFNHLFAIARRHVMASNVSFVFSVGNWESENKSITTWLNCAFTSSLEVATSSIEVAKPVDFTKLGDFTSSVFHSFGRDTFKNCSFEISHSPGLMVNGRTDVEKCVFSGGEYSGVHVSTEGHLEIKESKIHGNETGIFMAKASAGCNITNCEIFDNKWNGVFVLENTSNVTVKNCRIYHNDHNGIYVADSSSVSVSNSEIFENGWMGIATVSNGRCTISHNKIYGNKSGGVQVVPVGPSKEVSPSIVEFNEIFDNRGYGIYYEMMAEDTPSDTSVPPSKKSLEESMYYRRNLTHFKNAKCRENTCFNNDSTLSSAASTDSRINADFCFYCRKRCSKVCAKCFVTTYCNEECQKGDWKKHKRECRPILEKSTVCLNIPKKEERSINVEHFMFFPNLSTLHPGLAAKGPIFTNATPPKTGERFLVKILAADEKWHSNSVGPMFTICDRSLTISGCLDRNCFPRLYRFVKECGVISTILEGWKKKFFWAQLHDQDCKKLRVFMTKFPPHERW